MQLLLQIKELELQKQALLTPPRPTDAKLNNETKKKKWTL